MKKLLVLAFAIFCVSANVCAQSSKDVRKERLEIKKTSTKELEEKSTKLARKDAKNLAKEGWTTAPGSLPLEKQLDRVYKMQYEFDDDNFPKYLMGMAMSVGGNYDAARMQAMELAKLNLAGQIQTEITALVENSVDNKQLTEDEAASITKSIQASKSLISQSIGRTILVTECHRMKGNKNKEVLIRIAYNSAMAKAAAKRAIQSELEGKSDELQKKLDSALGW